VDGTAPPVHREHGLVPEVLSARRIERLLMRVRYLMAALVVGSSLLFEPASDLGAAAVALLLLGGNVLAHREVPRVRTVAAARGLALRTTAVDLVAAAAFFGLFLRDPSATPVALLTSVVLGVALRWSWRAVGLAVAAFVVAVGVRAYVRTEVLEHGAPRLELVGLWIVVALLVAALGHEIQDQERRWQLASSARERVAADLRATVTQTLSFAGIGPDQATHEEVLAAVRSIVDGESEGRDRLIERVATVLAVPHHGLSPREQEILLLLARGHPDARIAAALFISPSTVRNHLQNMRSKLGLGSRAELAEFAGRYALPT
jgi:DNA-binding CsgD family transcriptional regulator